jgi:hypothetical protein
LVAFRIDSPNKGQVTVILINIQAIPEYELIWNGKPPVMNRYLDLPPFELIEKCTDLQAARVAGPQQFEYRGNGIAAVYDVFYQQYIAVLDSLFQVESDPDRTSGMTGTNP